MFKTNSKEDTIKLHRDNSFPIPTIKRILDLNYKETLLHLQSRDTPSDVK